MKLSINDIRSVIHLEEVIGNSSFIISKVKKIDLSNDEDDALMWVSDKNAGMLSDLLSGVVLCSESVALKYNGNLTLLVTKNPRFAFQQIVSRYFDKPLAPSISSHSVIHSTVQLGKNCTIGNFVTIEEDCVLGDNVTIGSNTVILRGTIIKNNVKIGCNCTIGGLGFGYEQNPESKNYEFIPHIGNVVLMNDVEIGNNTCIDRAVLGSTILSKNVKVDNLVHIAHGVVVGENSLVIANAMVAGSVEIGKNCWIAPSSSILNKKVIGDNVTVGIASLVMKDTPSDITVMGVPAEEFKLAVKNKQILKAIISEYKNSI